MSIRQRAGLPLACVSVSSVRAPLASAAISRRGGRQKEATLSQLPSSCTCLDEVFAGFQVAFCTAAAVLRTERSAKAIERKAPGLLRQDVPDAIRKRRRPTQDAALGLKRTDEAHPSHGN